MNDNVYWKLSYGVYVISTIGNGKPTGCVANCAMQVTVTPATIAVSINHDNYTNSSMNEFGYFAINILPEEANPEVIRIFGFSSGKECNKFEHIPYRLEKGIPVLTDSCGYLLCKLVDKLETNTHTVFLGEILDGDVPKDVKPMTYEYYHTVLKGRSSQNAPTYIADNKEDNKDKYICSICGYVYEGEVPFEELPDSYVCPLCKQPKSKFVKNA